MNYLEQLMQESIIDQISDKEKNRLILDQIKNAMGSRDVQRFINEAITNQINNMVKQYIDEHPESFNEINNVVNEEFDKELKKYGAIRRVVKQFILKATWKYYIKQYFY